MFVLKISQGMTHKTVSDEAKPSDLHMDIHFISGTGSYCDELSAKAS